MENSSRDFWSKCVKFDLNGFTRFGVEDKRQTDIIPIITCLDSCKFVDSKLIYSQET